VFAHGLRGPAVPVTILDDAGVRWLAGLQVPGLHALLRGLVRGSSWWVLFMLSLGLPLALLVLRRWRHLIVWLVAWNLGSFVIGLVAMTARRPRPFAVELQSSWGGWAMPSLPVAILTGTLIGVLYGLVPQGRWRNTGKGVAATLVAMVAVARIALGTDAPTDVLVAVGIGLPSRCWPSAGSPPTRSTQSPTTAAAAPTWTSAAPAARPSAGPCSTSSA
jgi:hypothetical protein